MNAATIKDSFPMPTVDELLDELFGARFFSKLDLKAGYHQIWVALEDCYKIAFRIHHGLYEWLVMVLSVLRYNYLVAKLSKCSFGQRSIDYLGHIVSGKTVLVDDAKVSDIKNWPIPTSVRQLWGFLGLASYYRKFIKNFSMMASSLTDLLQKESFCWSNSAEEAFNTLKNALMNAPVLATIFL
ncbi:uncharacterized mitochondrial protein AtMg00860-like [Arachis hypogaea]|uniref:uncharacterized mitochondrial protein AtMg00860-like n=1 Tax=Arachis hypogaea TaxID=3818 RepID=UPI003B20DCD3